MLVRLDVARRRVPPPLCRVRQRRFRGIPTHVHRRAQDVCALVHEQAVALHAAKTGQQVEVHLWGGRGEGAGRERHASAVRSQGSAAAPASACRRATALVLARRGGPPRSSRAPDRPPPLRARLEVVLGAPVGLPYDVAACVPQLLVRVQLEDLAGVEEAPPAGWLCLRAARQSHFVCE
jgi:hypothetical protein